MSEPAVESLIASLKSLRRKYRREATRLSKWSAAADSPSWKERCYGESNVYEMCANDIDAILRAAADALMEAEGK